jgi:hypothetical protein
MHQGGGFLVSVFFCECLAAPVGAGHIPVYLHGQCSHPILSMTSWCHFYHAFFPVPFLTRFFRNMMHKLNQTHYSPCSLHYYFKMSFMVVAAVTLVGRILIVS